MTKPIPRDSYVCCMVALLALTACGKSEKAVGTAPAVHGQTSKPGAFLAYEHTVRIKLAADTVHAKIAASQAACDEGRYGACSVLRIEEDSSEYPNGTVTVRIVPAGIGPLVHLAAEGGTVGSRETRAEDLAEAVADTAQKRELLTRQRAKLAEFQARKELSVSDMLMLSRESAAVDAQLDALAKTANDEQRRLETNLLTLNFRADREASRWARIGDAFGGMFDRMADGVADTVEMIGFGLPIILIAFPLALLWRWLWRRVTRKAAD